MPLLLAVFVVVHASIHIGYICGPAWPFVATDPWLVALLDASPDTVRAVGVALVLVSFVAYLLAAVAATGFVRSLWKPLIVTASVASAITGDRLRSSAALDTPRPPAGRQCGDLAPSTPISAFGR